MVDYGIITLFVNKVLDSTILNLEGCITEY